MFYLHRGEKFGLGILGLLWVIIGLYGILGGVPVAWAGFAPGFLLFGSIMAFGIWLRLLDRMPRLSATLMILGIYTTYASLLALVNYQQFPLSSSGIDPILLQIDALLGYDWAAGVSWLAENPDISGMLKWVYLSALGQLGLLVLLLGLTGRLATLHHLLITGMVAGLATLAIWSMFPSFGPSAFVALDPEVEVRAGLLVTNEYGAHLLRLAQNGLEQIENHQIFGTVAFPSFHIVMGLLAWWFARGTWLSFPFGLMLVAMVPATALHGGHHLVDLIGGALLFLVTLMLTRRLLPEGQVTTSGAVRPVRAANPVSA